jgi:hypothetical protein
MDVVTYTGTGASRSITGVGFSPDFLWIKARSGSGYHHHVYDSVRGIDKFLRTSTTQSEFTVSPLDQITSLNADGFTLGSDSASPGALEVNELNRTYVGWLWDAGTSTVSNPDGSITSQVRANATAGFSVATWSGSGSGSVTVGHGLGVAPKMMIVKDRSNARNWLVYHTSLGASSGLALNSTTAASGADGGWWNNTAPTSTVATIGTYGNESANYVGYFFSSVVGYSNFGSYVGNGSSDGVFVFLGFRPKWIMVKNTTASASWTVWDSVRDIDNVIDLRLRPNTSESEASLTNSFNNVDFLSNGFKLRGSAGDDANTNGATYIYAAFAEAPFNYSRAR